MLRPHINSHAIIFQSRRCLGWDYSLWPGSAQGSDITQDVSLKIPRTSLQLSIAVSAGRGSPQYDHT